jgi:hypothetical protein
MLAMGADRKGDGPIQLLKGDAGLLQSWFAQPALPARNIQTMLAGVHCGSR